jgi:phosphopantothenate synthetase
MTDYEPRKLHELWMEQCEAVGAIKERYGLKAAFDYLVGEKLLNFTEAASEHRAFAQELPRFRVGGPADVLCRGDRGASCPNRTRTARG